jgi:phosphoribosylformylglycinamidine cyclo-ligase
MKNDYKASGVDVEAGYRSVELMKASVKNTFRKEVLTDLGGFGGLFSIAKAKDMQDPVLVSGTDGVGTKLKIAFLMDKHDTIGIDCVAMCVNDIICSGAEPLFFLDYIACGKNYPEKIASIVKGVSEGCLMAGASLIGGETAEMPGFYPVNEYDLAGFAVGIMDKAKIINGSTIQSGDVLIGIASSGIHSNGYSLVRKILRPSEANVNSHIESLGTTLGEELLKPTRIYVKSILELVKTVNVKGISNITGGGFIENIPRMMPKGKKVRVQCGTWTVPPIFDLMKSEGELEDMDMYNTFNMGIGMTLAVSPADVDKTLEQLRSTGEIATVIGDITDGDGIDICLK